jgi:mono/diheme cytochrome c family protein
MNIKFTTLVLICLISAISGCYNDKEDLLYPTNVDCNDPAQRGPKFTQVQLICQNQCVSCHGTGGSSPDLSKDCNIVSKWQTISERCNSTDPQRRMPKNGQLSTSDLLKVNEWVAAGHKFND